MKREKSRPEEYRQCAKEQSQNSAIKEEVFSETQSVRAQGLTRVTQNEISLDVIRAFDVLPHSLYIQKLAKYIADDNTVSLNKDYLRDRNQRVKLAGTFTPWLPVNRGIPKGSILGPLLFNIFIERY